METLNNEENIRILKYVDNVMTPEERSEFEADLEKSEALRKGLAFERKLLQVGKSAAMKKKEVPGKEKKNKDENLLALIQQARENWEKNNMQPVPEEVAATATITTPTEKPEAGTGKPERIRIGKVLCIAAMFIVIALLGIAWYIQSTKDKRHQLKDHPPVVKKEGKEINTYPAGVSQPQVTPPSESTKTQEVKTTPAPNEVIAKTNKEVKRPTPTKAERDALFASNRKEPDKAPEDVPRPVQKAFAYYKNNDFKEASLAFHKAEMLETRGYEEDEQLTGFYIHYYRAQCLIAMDSAAKAIPSLKAAIAASPDRLWKSKAQWNLALAYLKTGDLKKMESLLNQLAGNNKAGVYKQKAAKLISDLEKK